MPVNAYAARGARQKLEPFHYEPGPLGKREVERTTRWSLDTRSSAPWPQSGNRSKG
jgi:hypothetical protein